MMPGTCLPDAWVARIWGDMRATYGSAFDRQWQAPEGADPARHVAELKAVWSRELGPLQRNPQAIAHALANLPERPPNLVEFRRLCAGAPQIVPPALPAPKPDPQRLAAALSRMAEVARQTRLNGKAWAWDLKAREEAGENLTPVQRRAWREVLRPEMSTTEGDE